MRRLSGALLLIVVGCAAAAVETTTTEVTTPATTLPPTTTTTLAGAIDECPPAPYEIDFLPINVNGAGFDPSGLEPDVWTSVGGTQTTFFGRSDGTVAIGLIRGTLPAVDWPAEKGEIEIDGVRAAVGPHPDGTWAAGWVVAPEARCDLYTVVFYLPWSPKDVEAVLLSIKRVAG
jgi:hypothetical protein